MHFSYDQNVDALNIRILEDVLVSRTEEVDSGTLVDLDERGRVVAIEVIRLARHWPIDAIATRFDISEEDVAVLRSLWRESLVFPFVAPAAVAAVASSPAGELAGSRR